MFLDSDGTRLRKHTGARSTRGFEESLLEVQAFENMRKKAEAGNAKAATFVLIRQLQLEWFDYEEAKTRAAALTLVTSKQKRELAQLLIDTEVRSTRSEAGSDGVKLLQAGEHFHSMWESKRVPTSQGQLYAFWSVMADYAESKRDRKLFARIVTAFRDTLGNPRYRRGAQELEYRLRNSPRR